MITLEDRVHERPELQLVDKIDDYRAGWERQVVAQYAFSSALGLFTFVYSFVFMLIFAHETPEDPETKKLLMVPLSHLTYTRYWLRVGGLTLPICTYPILYAFFTSVSQVACQAVP